MNTTPVAIYCRGPHGDGKKHLLARLVQALAQRGLRVGVMRQGVYPAGCNDVYVAAGAAAHLDVCAGRLVTASVSAEQECCEKKLFLDCHILLVDIDRCEGRVIAGLNISDNCYAGFGLVSPDAVVMAELIENSVLRPLISAAVLAGGRSSRLGRNKALLPMNGKTVIEKVIGEVRACVGSLRLITNTPEEYEHLGYPCRPDVLPGGGPLSGIHAALTHCNTEYVLVVSCDIPLVRRDFFQQLIAALSGYDIVIFKHRQFEPLCALYRQTCIPALEELIAHGEYRIIDLFPTLRVNVLRTPAADAFRSINTDADYKSVIDACSDGPRDPDCIAGATGRPC